jgi:hypothetical protein
MGFLGRELQLPPEKLPDECRARGRAHWEMRLAAGVSSSNLDDYRDELGAIGQWFIHDAVNIDPVWLLDQLLRMLKVGFAPNNGYSLVEWLGKIASSHPNKAIEVFSELLSSPHLNHWTYTTHRVSIRAPSVHAKRTAATPCALRSRSARNLGAVRPLQRKNLTRRRESVFMVDIADRAVAIRFVPGYDDLCFA